MKFEELEKYKHNGSFTLMVDELFGQKCKAPNDNSGVYLIYSVVNGQEELIYIGSSGQKNKDGTLKHRQGGMRDRLINGYHPNRFGEVKRIKRSKAFPKQMLKENLIQIKIYWWVTYDQNHSDFPADVESSLRNKYLNKYGRLPSWHKGSL